MNEPHEGRPPRPGQAPQSPRDAARDLAVQLYLDALLQRAMSRGDEDRRAIEAALERLRHEPPAAEVSAEPPAPRVWTAGLLRAAGLLAVAGLALWFALGPSAPQATAALATALEHARRTAELAYGLELVRPARRGPDLEGTLYVRGDEAFALHTRSPMGADLWLGGDRREVWLVPGAASLPVLVAERGSAMLELFDEHGLELPFVDVVTALEACARDFEVELHDGGRLLRGVRRAGAGPGPDTLELQLDGQGRLARLELRRTGLAPALDWCFALERRQETVEPAVLERESHHDPGRRVLRR